MGGLPSSIIHIAIHRLVYPPKGSVTLILYKLFIIFHSSFSTSSHLFPTKQNKIRISIYYSLKFTGVDPEAEIVYFTDEHFFLHL